MSVRVTPWHWQGGEVFPEVLDAAIDPARMMNLGEGVLQYSGPATRRTTCGGSAPFPVRGSDCELRTG